MQIIIHEGRASTLEAPIAYEESPLAALFEANEDVPIEKLVLALRRREASGDC